MAAAGSRDRQSTARHSTALQQKRGLGTSEDGSSDTRSISGSIGPSGLVTNGLTLEFGFKFSPSKLLAKPDNQNKNKIKGDLFQPSPAGFLGLK